ncbi:MULTISPECIES: hypothetical protein [Deefgea]|uniref:Copper-binding protein n=1 Tax=Deefgea chitinilytica TaxID=570276 RepID=A0ABS2CCS9_9NEIS|nr:MULTISPECIES: hypothetical protein [Deefgea]MBM5571968.1 hypothetical protein [Deefgea chitinilytica]MBM9889203.1 hypothetical protein [Deefgea sp. CFH1-16]
MHKNLLGSMFLVAGLLLGQVAHAEQAAADEVIMSVAEFEKEQAVVVSVDLATRSVVLAMQNGRTLEFDGIDAKVALDQVKPGDLVNVAGSQAIVLMLHKGGAGMRSIVETSGRDATANGVGTVITRTVRNDIVSVDLKKGEAVVRNVPGEFITIPVPNKDLLARASAGDQLLIVTRIKAVVWGQ